MLVHVPHEDLLTCNTDMVQENFYGFVCPLLSDLFIAMGCEEKLSSQYKVLHVLLLPYPF
jgi:hypothetical protein